MATVVNITFVVYKNILISSSMTYNMVYMQLWAGERGGEKEEEKLQWSENYIPSKIPLWPSFLLFRLVYAGAALPPRIMDVPPLVTFSHGLGDGERDRAVRPINGLEGRDRTVSFPRVRPRWTPPTSGEVDLGGDPLFSKSVIPLPTRFLIRKKALLESSDCSALASSPPLLLSSLPRSGDRLPAPNPPDNSASICLSRSRLTFEDDGREWLPPSACGCCPLLYLAV